MKTLPVALLLEGKRALVVGGGSVAARKVAALVEAGALVTVIAPELAPDFPAPLEHFPRRFEANDCQGFALVFAATNVREVNRRVADEAKAHGIPVNDASDPLGSDFHTQAVVRRGPITVGVSTDGESPVVAAQLKRQIEAAIGPEWEQMFALASEFDVPKEQRGQFWKALLGRPVLRLLRGGQSEEARREIERLVGGE